MIRPCPACGSADTRYREKRGDWFCDACDHAWAGGPPSVEPADGLVADAVSAFISYGHADASELAVRLRADLEARGVHPVWLDSEMIRAGGLWTVSIEHGIREADVVLAIMSPHSLRADSICQEEVALAVAEHKRVVPIRFTTDPALAPSLLLVRRSWADFSGDYASALEQLLRALSGDETSLAQPLATVAGQRPLDFAFDIAERSSGFIGREWLVAEIEAWLASGGHAFVIVGEPGIGKSAIAAHLASRSDAAAVHFCSTGNRDTLAPLAFVANLVVALGARLPAFGAAVARRNPAEPRDDAVTAFRQLVVEPARAIEPPAVPQLIIIDALDEAAKREGETIIDLIAEHAQSLPAWLRLVVTSRPETGITSRLQALSPVELSATQPENRADLAAYLKKRLGAFDPGAVATLIDVAAGNFLYAKMSADALEAGTFAVSDLHSLPRGIANFYVVLFRKAFPDLLVYLSDEAPILRPLAVAVAPLPFAILQAASGLDASTLNLRLVNLRSYLKVDGVGEASTYALFHRSLGDWLRDRDRAGAYWCDPATGHAQLVAALQVDPARNAYAVRGLPHHLAALGRWDDLADLLAGLPFFAAAWDQDSQAVQIVWAEVEAKSDRRIVDAYRGVLEEPEGSNDESIDAVASILRATGHLTQAILLWEHLALRYRRMGDHKKLARSLGEQASALRYRADLDGAMVLFKESEQICRDLGDQRGLAWALGGQARILYPKGDVDGAMALHKESERICRDLGDQHGLAKALDSQAYILDTKGDLDGAMVLLKEAERICREFGDLGELKLALNGQAGILDTKGDLDGAMALHKESERICRDLGDQRDLTLALSGQARILDTKGDLDGAMALHKESERICRDLGDLRRLARALNGQAGILDTKGDLDEAMALHKEAERICRDLGYQRELTLALDGQAHILRNRGDLDGAMALHKESERICRDLGDQHGLAKALNGQAGILDTKGDLDGAMAPYKESERICRDLGDQRRLAWALGGQARILDAKGDLDGAMALHKEAERIYRDLGDQRGLAWALGGQAHILDTKGDLDGAMALYKESGRICRDLGDQRRLAWALGGQAHILRNRGDLDGAMALNKESERICRDHGDQHGLAKALNGQAGILDTKGDLDGAMALNKESERICREFGYQRELTLALGGQARILDAKGDLDGAMALLKEAEQIWRNLGDQDGVTQSLVNQTRILETAAIPTADIPS